jgi:hypothetical protein
LDSSPQDNVVVLVGPQLFEKGLDARPVDRLEVGQAKRIEPGAALWLERTVQSAANGRALRRESGERRPARESDGADAMSDQGAAASAIGARVPVDQRLARTERDTLTG